MVVDFVDFVEVDFQPIPHNIYIFGISSLRAFKPYQYMICLDLLIIFRIFSNSDFFRKFEYRYKQCRYGYGLKALNELIPNMYILWGIG